MAQPSWGADLGLDQARVNRAERTVCWFQTHTLVELQEHQLLCFPLLWSGSIPHHVVVLVVVQASPEAPVLLFQILLNYLPPDQTGWTSFLKKQR